MSLKIRRSLVAWQSVGAADLLASAAGAAAQVADLLDTLEGDADPDRLLTVLSEAQRHVDRPLMLLKHLSEVGEAGALLPVAKEVLARQASAKDLLVRHPRVLRRLEGALGHEDLSRATRRLLSLLHLDLTRQGAGMTDEQEARRARIVGRIGELQVAPRRARSLSVVAELLRQRCALAQMLRFPSYLAMCRVGHAQEDVQRVYDLADDVLALLGEGDGACDRWSEERSESAAVQRAPLFFFRAAVDWTCHYLGRCFDLSIERCTADAHVWHPDVVLLSVSDADGALRGWIYLDLLGRSGKRPGEWTSYLADRHASASEEGLPVAAVCCGFGGSKASSEPPSLCFLDVRILLHELGHALTHVVTVETTGLRSGIRHAPWDTVEIPSLFVEKLAFEEDFLLGLCAEVPGLDGPTTVRRLRRLRRAPAEDPLRRLVFFSLVDLDLHALQGGIDAARVRAVAAGRASRCDPESSAALAGSLRRLDAVFGGAYAGAYHGYLLGELVSAQLCAMLARCGTGAERRELLSGAGQALLMHGRSGDFRRCLELLPPGAPHARHLVEYYFQAT